MTRKSVLMLAAAVLSLGAAGMAVAQPGPRGTAPAPLYDPAQLPVVKGQVAQYSLTPRGDVDGLILADGTQVHVPPFMSTQLVHAVKPGDAVTIHGLKARAIAMVAARSITNDASGTTVLVMPPQHGRFARGPALEAEGKVASVIHTPRGEASGVRLEDGTLVRLPPHEASRLAELLAPGKSVAVRGEGYSGPLGRVIVARQLGADKDKLEAVASPRMGRGDGMRDGMHDGMHRGHREHGERGRMGEPGRERGPMHRQGPGGNATPG